MKKSTFYLFIALAIILSLSLIACNKGSSTSQDTTSDTSPEVTTAEETTTAPDNEDETDLPDSTETGTPILSLKGKKLSILGDSISTFQGVSNNAS